MINCGLWPATGGPTHAIPLPNYLYQACAYYLVFWPGQSKTLGRALILFRALKALNGHALNQATAGLSGAKSLVLIHYGDRFV